MIGTIVFSPDSRGLWADVIHNQVQGTAGYIVRWAARSGQRLGPPREIGGTPETALTGFIGRGAQW